MKRLFWLLIFCCTLLISFSGCAQVGQIVKFPTPEIPAASKLFDIKGRELAVLYEENRTPVKLSKISPYLIKAIIAIEDARFYQHKGIDPVGIGRALIKDIKAGKVIEGGSTITQQTAKNIFLSNERTWLRKIREAVLTIQLEQRYTKDEILAMYLNQIYFGHGAYGVEVAAQTYFGKSAAELSLAESALLAGLPKGPNLYSPFRNLSNAQKRQTVVLNRMLELGQITQSEYNQAKKEQLILRSSPKLKKNKAPFLVDEVREYITEKYENGAELLLRGGLSVYTTLDLDMQNAAENALVEGLKKYNKDIEGAVVAIEPNTGYVKAMVGGRDYKISSFNRSYARRQPGSAFKPFLYAAAIDRGLTAGTTFSCDPVTFRSDGDSNYTPTDYSQQKYHFREFTLTEALVKSDNVVSVKLNQQLGADTLVGYARRLGITSPLRPYLSLVLGTSEVSPVEMAAAYGVFANRGRLAKSMFIIKIQDQDGIVLEENTSQVKEAIPAHTAYIITDMLKGVLQPGGTAEAAGAGLNRPAAGKTGTTQDYRDAWFVGYTPELSTAVYVGYDKPRSTGMTGGNLAAPIWGNFIRKALQGTPVRDFTRPADVVTVKICADTGMLATPFSEQIIETSFIQGTEPTTDCPNHSAPWYLGNWFWRQDISQDYYNNQ